MLNSQPTACAWTQLLTRLVRKAPPSLPDLGHARQHFSAMLGGDSKQQDHPQKLRKAENVAINRSQKRNNCLRAETGRQSAAGSVCAGQPTFCVVRHVPTSNREHTRGWRVGWQMNCSEGGFANTESTHDVLLRIFTFMVSVWWHYNCYSTSLPNSWGQWCPSSCLKLATWEIGQFTAWKLAMPQTEAWYCCLSRFKKAMKNMLIMQIKLQTL